MQVESGNDADMEMVTPPPKKLKQARLSFQKLSPSIISPKNLKKRKISEDSDDIQVVKILKQNDLKPLEQDEKCVSDLLNKKENDCNSSSECKIVATQNQKVEKEEKIKHNNEKSSNKCIHENSNSSKCKEIVRQNENTENEHLKDKKESENTENEHLKDKKESENTENEHLKDKKESENTENEHLKDKKESENTENEHLKDKKESENTLNCKSPSFENVNKVSDDHGISFNETEVVEIDSDSSESDSVESSDNELNETIEDHNSSGSGDDSVKGDDAGPSSSKTTPEKSCETDTPQTPKSNLIDAEGASKKKLTPKQLLRREQAAKRREEKQKQRKEKERKRAEEKEVKLKETLEKKERKRKEREERREQKRKEKEEKEKKKQAELEQKSEEKRIKEEEKRKKEELRDLEKRKKEEKKLAEEEAKKKVAAAFANFFVTPKGGSKADEVRDKAVEHFMPFQVKADMRLAPLVRTKFDENRIETFEEMLKAQSSLNLYLKSLKDKAYIPGKSGKTWPLCDLREVVIIDEDDDVIPVSSENEVVESHPTITHPKAKLMLFCENRRPPYWGTWTKRSKCIKPRCPFNKDEGFFDYEVDSDDEWEEEEPGESLHGSDDEKESEDEYEVDNEFFVPHGYLSDEENNEEEETTTPESMKAKLKFLEMEFEEEMKHKTERIKPRLFGCFWTNQNSNQIGARVLALLSSYRAVCQESPIVLSGLSSPEISSPVNENQGTCPSTGSKRKKFPESFVPALIKLVHGNINSRGFLVKEFSSYMKNQVLSTREESENDGENNQPPVNSGNVSKLKISEKIKQIASWIACPEEGPFLNRMCWYVPSEIRSAYGLEDLVIPNKVWNYFITPKRELELSNMIPSPIVSDVNPRSRSISLITKFTKKMSQEERQKQLALARSCGDDGIEILEETKLESIDNGKMFNGNKLDKINTSLKKSEDNALNSPVIFNAKLLDKGKRSSEGSGIRKKLLQFKSKNSGIIPHLQQHKRVPILKSVPLGQTISPSTPKMSKSVTMDSENSDDKNSVEVKNASNAEDCIIEID